MEDTQGTTYMVSQGGGWVFVRDPSSGVIAWVRFDVDPSDGRLVPALIQAQAHDIEMSPRGRRQWRIRALRGSDLRKFPLNEVEAAANGALREKILALIDLKSEMQFVRPDGEAHRPPKSGGKPAPAPPPDLSVPTSRPYPDAFYAEVGALYAHAASHSHRPAAWIAEGNGVPVKSVHRWIAEARKRGHLAPGRKGRAG